MPIPFSHMPPFIHQHQEADGKKRREEERKKAQKEADRRKQTEEDRRRDQEKQHEYEMERARHVPPTPYDPFTDPEYVMAMAEVKHAQYRDPFPPGHIIKMFHNSSIEGTCLYILNNEPKENQAEYLYKFATYLKELATRKGKLKYASFESVCDALIKTKDAKYLIYFAEMCDGFKGVDMDKITNAIIESKELDKIYDFATRVKSANLEKLNTAVAQMDDKELFANHWVALHYAYDFIYKHACENKGVDANELVSTIARFKSFNLLYLFAKDVPGIDVKTINKELQNMNYYLDKLGYDHDNKGDEEYIYKLAKEIEGIDIDRLAEIVANSEKMEYIKIFHDEFPGLDINRLAKAVAKTGNMELINQFINEIPEIDVEKMTDVICKIGNSYIIYNYAKNIKNADIQKLYRAMPEGDSWTVSLASDYRDQLDYADAVWKAGTDYEVFAYAMEFAKNSPNDIPVHIDALTQRICNSDNPEMIYEFALNVKGANIELLTDAMCGLREQYVLHNMFQKTFNYVYKFALNVKGANIDKLTDKACSLCYNEYSYDDLRKFAKNIPGVNNNKIIEAIIHINNVKVTKDFMEDFQIDVEKIADVLLTTSCTYRMVNFILNFNSSKNDQLLDKFLENLVSKKGEKYYDNDTFYMDLLQLLTFGKFSNTNKLKDYIMDMIFSKYSVNNSFLSFFEKFKRELVESIDNYPALKSLDDSIAVELENGDK